MPNAEPWSELAQFISHQNLAKVTCKELSFTLAALANAIPDAFFAKLFADKFAAQLGFDAESQQNFANYAAIMTGLTSLAINRASLLTAIESSIDLFKQSKQHHLLDGRFLIAWGVLLIVAAAGAIPGFQFASDTAEGWNTGLAALLIGVQLINFTASNMRPIIDTIAKRGFSKHNTDVVSPLRRDLLHALNQQLEASEQVSNDDLALLAEGILVRPRYTKTSIGLQFFTAITVPCYAVSYYFASEMALSSWHLYLRSMIGAISALMKWLFMCRTSFSLISKFINAMTNAAILAIVEEQHLPQWLHNILGIISVFAGMTSALSSAGGLLNYLLPQVGFLDGADSLMGLLEALGISLITSGPSKIFDISEMLSHMVETVAHYLSKDITNEQLRLGANKTQFVLRLMRAITVLSPAQFMLRFTVLDAETGNYVANAEYRHVLELTSTIHESNYSAWLTRILHPGMPEDVEIAPAVGDVRISIV